MSSLDFAPGFGFIVASNLLYWLLAPAFILSEQHISEQHAVQLQQVVLKAQGRGADEEQVHHHSMLSVNVAFTESISVTVSSVTESNCLSAPLHTLSCLCSPTHAKRAL